MADNNHNPNTNILKFLPSHYSQGERKFLVGLIKAINGSNEKLELLLRACIDQLFLPTAQGRYLINLAESQGFTLPPNSGLDIRSYKPLVPVMVADPKQVRETIEELVKAFYFTERLKPSVTSSVTDTYSLLDGDNLIIETETGTYNISFTENDFNDITKVSASEMAAIINSTQQNIIADAPVDRITSKNFLRITSNTKGAAAFIRVAGGTIQNILKFPNLANTNIVVGAVFNLTKTVPYTDRIKIQWNGVGPNPQIYNVNIGDFLTIRGLVDGVHPYSKLNGSYKILDAGYDYIEISNTQYNVLTSSLTIPNLNSFVFTKQDFTTIFDQDEFAISSETDTNTISITVPAIPPLARRFLRGATHLRGIITPVLDFTRNTIKISLGTGQQVPAAVNVFKIFNDFERLDFREKSYKTINVDTSLTTPTFNVSSSDIDHSALPFTVNTGLGVSFPIFGEIDSDEFLLKFNYKHGLKYRWGFTLSNAIGGPWGNITVSDINKEHVVFSVQDEKNIKFRIFNSGVTKKFEGFDWGVGPGLQADVYQYPIIQSDGSDFYLKFASPAAAVASGLVKDLSFKFDFFGGTNIDVYVANNIRYKKCVVKSVSGDTVNISTGYGPGASGLVMTGLFGKRSGDFTSLSSLQYRFDKTSTYNTNNVMSSLKSIFFGYTKPNNPNFTNSYIYDPNGIKTKVTVSRFIAKTEEKIFKGDTLVSIKVNTLKAEDGTNFPKSGEIIIGYSTDKFEGPIRYFALSESSGNNQIIIDQAYKFKFTHEAGTQIQVIRKNFAFEPDINADNYATYLTGTTTARQTMFKLIRDLLASGIFLEQDVIFPDQRYKDSAFNIFD